MPLRFITVHEPHELKAKYSMILHPALYSHLGSYGKYFQSRFLTKENKVVPEIPPDISPEIIPEEPPNISGEKPENPLLSSYFRNIGVRGLLLLRAPVGLLTRETVISFTKGYSASFVELNYGAIFSNFSLFIQSLPQIFEYAATPNPDSPGITILLVENIHTIRDATNSPSVFALKPWRILIEVLKTQDFASTGLLVLATVPPEILLDMEFLDLFDAQIVLKEMPDQIREELLIELFREDISESREQLTESMQFRAIYNATAGWTDHALEKLVNMARLKAMTITGDRTEKKSSSLLSETLEVIEQGLIFHNNIAPEELGKLNMQQIRPLHSDVKEKPIEITNLTRKSKILDQMYQDAASNVFVELSQTLEKLSRNEPLQDEERALLGDYNFVLKDKPEMALVRLNRAKKIIDGIRKFFSDMN